MKGGLATCMLFAAGAAGLWPDALAAGGPDAAVLPVAGARTLDGQELLRIGDLHEAQHHLQEALPYYQRALDAFRAKHDRNGEAAALVRIADITARQGRQEEARKTLEAAVGLLAGLGDAAAQARALVRLGRISESLGLETASEEVYRRAGELFDRARDRPGRSDSQIRLGGLLVSQGRQEDGLRLLDAALADARARQDSQQQIAALIGIGDGRWEGEQPGPAQAAYEEALRLAETGRDARAEGEVRTRLSRLYAEVGRYDDAMTTARRALTLYETLRDRRREADTLSLLGNLHLLGGKPDVAAVQHERALRLYRALRDRMREAGSLANLAVTYEAQGLMQDARETQDKVIFLLQSSAD